MSDVLEFGLGLLLVCAFVATKSSKDVSPLVFTANFDKPPRRLREEPDDTEEEEKRNYLESYRKSPTYACGALVDK